MKKYEQENLEKEVRIKLSQISSLINIKLKREIEKDYSDINLYKNDLNIVDYSLFVWNNLLENFINDEIIYEDESLNNKELEHIIKNKTELD